MMTQRLGVPVRSPLRPGWSALALPWMHLPAGGHGHRLLGAVRGGARPAARLHRAAVLRARRLLGRLGVRDRAGRHPHRRAVPGGGARRGAGRGGARACRSATWRCERAGIYFAMVTLAFAQMVYFVANQWRSVTGGENGLQGVPREAVRAGPVRPVLLLLRGAADGRCSGCSLAWRIVHSPFGRVLVAIRDNPARARALGYPVQRYKLLAFVLSAVLAGLGRRAVRDRRTASPRCRTLHWTTSGKVVIMVVLGGIGTLWGGVLGAARWSSTGGLAGHRRLRRHRPGHRRASSWSWCCCSGAASSARSGTSSPSAGPVAPART